MTSLRVPPRRPGKGIAAICLRRPPIALGALAVGLGRAAYGAALRYARERTTFGKPIVEHQAISFKLADMLTQLHAASLLVYHAAWLMYLFRSKQVRHTF